MYKYEATVNYKNKSGAVETTKCVVVANDAGDAQKKIKAMYPTLTYMSGVRLIGKA